MLLLMPAANHRSSVLAIVLVALCSGCATSSALKLGEQAEGRQDFDRAVVEYTSALRKHPNDANARQGLERAKLRAAAEHFYRGRRLSGSAKLEEALIEYQLASELNPSSREIDEALTETRTQLRAKVAVAREGKTQLETLMDRARNLPPMGLDLPTDVKMPDSLTFRDASSRLIFLTIARMSGISLGFDSTFRETPITIDLRSASLETALGAVADATRTFFRVTAQNTVLVIPDTPAKRREYEEEVVRTFYLSNADLKETQDLMRLVLDARRISPTTANNAITIKDTPERVSAAARLIAAIDKARPEVVIDVELLEVDRTKLLEYGLQLASPGSPGIDGSVSIAPQPDATTLAPRVTLQTLHNLTQADILLANLPSLYYRLLKSDTNTRALANPQLRTSEGIPARARFGERIPVPVTTFTPIATGGTPQQPIVSYNYEDIGVNIDITPRTHHNNDVTLALKVSVQAISGTGFNGLPTFANREVNTEITLRDGETNMLAGLIRDDERKVMDGIPGLSDLPVLGKIFTHTRTETTQSDIILTLTPHIVRVLDVDENDLRAFRVGRDSLSPVSEIPTPIDLSRPSAPPPVNQPPPSPAAQPIQPIQPPAQTPPAQPPPAPPPIVPR
jgi:general secretion pathway protein D